MHGRKCEFREEADRLLSLGYRLSFFFASLFITGCTFDKIESAPVFECSQPVSFVATIQPLINAHCAVSGCHVAGFTPGDFTSYAGIKLKAENGNLRLMVVDLKIMPPDSSITKDERKLIECWLNQGALNN